VTVKLKGLSELQTMLQTLPVKMEKNILRGGLRAAARVVQKEAQARIPRKSGLTARSLKLTTNTKNGTVTAKVKAKGKHAFIAPFIEYGTAAHMITAAGYAGSKFTFSGGKQAGIRTVNRRIKDGSLKIGDKFVGAFVMHPGTTPHPFLRPALDMKAGEAVEAMGNYIRARLTKEGLNAPAVGLVEDKE
jgi:HK97 gp10 family phage protein